MAIPIRGRRWTVFIDVEVTDQAELWRAARQAAGECQALDELIGREDDPDLAACVQLLATPDSLAGARVLGSEVAPAGG